MTIVCETDRLLLRQLTSDDGEVMLAVLNDPGFLRYIGDRGVRTLDDARAYIRNRMIASYEQHGFGMYLVVRRSDGEPVGICGLVKRDGLDDVDLGYALLSAHCGQGYARESAGAVLALARDAFGLKRVVAIVQPDNGDSIRLLENLGMTREGVIRLTAGAPEVLLYGCSLKSCTSSAPSAFSASSAHDGPRREHGQSSDGIAQRS